MGQTEAKSPVKMELLLAVLHLSSSMYHRTLQGQCKEYLEDLMVKGAFLVMLYYQVLVYFNTERGLSHGRFSEAKA